LDQVADDVLLRLAPAQFEELLEHRDQLATGFPELGRVAHRPDAVEPAADDHAVVVERLGI
jgi:hypothetical protein